MFAGYTKGIMNNCPKINWKISCDQMSKSKLVSLIERVKSELAIIKNIDDDDDASGKIKQTKSEAIKSEEKCIAG